jgi:hypothetical protein
MEISISKEVLPSIEECGFTETILGDGRGSIRQYRNSTGLHVREYRAKFIVHKDKADPRVDPIGHLVKDSPETLFAFGSSFLFSQGDRVTQSKPRERSTFNPVVFILSFLLLNRIFGVIKKLL